MDTRQDANRRRIVIDGVGLVTPLGHTAWATFQALLAGRTLADRAERLPEGIEPVQLARALGGVSLARNVARDPVIELAERAARQAIFEAGVEPGQAPLWLGTSKGAVHALSDAANLVHDQRYFNPEATNSDAWLAAALGPHQYLATQLSRRLGSPLAPHHVAACASSLTALHHAEPSLAAPPTSAISNQTSDISLVATADAALLPMFIHSYRRLGVLAELTPEVYRQRPLDARRSGFMLSEAGAAVLLRRLPAGQSPRPGQIELVDTAIAAESHDMVRPAPEMPALRHVAERLMGGRSIDMLHPHLPGTVEHDPTELAIHRDVLEACRDANQAGPGQRAGPGSPSGLYACKGALGHSLGAAGLSALVLACLCLKTGQRPPMPWLQQPMALDTGNGPLPLQPAKQTCSRTGAHAIFATGFGGHTAGAVIRRY